MKCVGTAAVNQNIFCQICQSFHFESPSVMSVSLFRSRSMNICTIVSCTSKKCAGNGEDKISIDVSKMHDEVVVAEKTKSPIHKAE